MRQKRVTAGSRYPKVYLTPKSLAQHHKNEKIQAMANKKAAKKLRRFDINIDNITDNDLLSVARVGFKGHFRTAVA